MEDYTPPNPYDAALTPLRQKYGNATTLRTASSTPESRFEDRYRQERSDEVTETAIELEILANTTPLLRHLSAEEEKAMTPPPAYDAAIKALREARR